MRFLFSYLLFFVCITFIDAQAPSTFNYQAVARNNAGVAIANQTIKVRLSIRQNTNTLYSETRTVTTNLLGLFNVQIGSAGASNVIGNINDIDWLNSAPGWLSLRVELDLANNNVFTDMGTQALTSTPFSLAANTALEPVNIAGRPINQTITPQTGSPLIWSGTEWVPKKDTIITRAGIILSIPATPSGTPPWIFLSNTANVTVTGTQTIIGNYVASLGHNSSSPSTISSCMCYRNVSDTNILPFFPGNFPDSTIPPSPTKISIPVTGAIKLPAGTYQIGMCIRNESTTVNLTNNDYINGVIQVIN
jgi:hypothetical protein